MVKVYYAETKYFLIMSLTKFDLLLIVGLLCLLLGGCSSGTTVEDAPVYTGEPAIDGLTDAILQTPEDASLYARRAGIYLEHQGYDEAISDLEKAIGLDSTKLLYHHTLADLYLEYYQSQKALDILQQTCRLFPGHLPSLLKLSEYQLILKKHQDAMNTLEEVFKADPLNAEAFMWFGMVLKDLGRLQESIPYFQKAVENDPELIDAWLELGQLYAEKKDPVAMQYFNSAIEMAPENTTALHAKASYFENADRLPEAIEQYKKISLVDPQYEASYFNRGLLYLEMDSVVQALKLFEITTKISPTHVKAYFYMGVANEMLGNPAKAKAHYEQVLNFDPDHPGAREALKKLPS